MTENPVIPEVLDHTNYKIWSNCMKTYLLGQDLWDIIEPEPEPEPEEESKIWRKKNALALHAIHMSIGKASLSAIGELESAKEAWDLLKSTIVAEPQSEGHDSDPESDAHGSDPESDAHTDTEEADSSDVEQVSIVDGIDYAPFMKVAEQGDWRAMKEFLDSHPDANVGVVVDDHTALHHVLDLGNTEIGGFLLDKMRNEDLEIQNDKTFTAFARLSYHNGPGVLKLLQRMVARNPKLPNIGDYYSVPAAMASWKGFKETTRYLYSVTDQEILNPDSGKIGVHLFINCINIKLFDIALEIVTKFPKILREQNNHGVYPIYALAKSLSAIQNENVHKKSRALRLSSWTSKSWNYVKYVRRLLGRDTFDRSQDEKVVQDQSRDLLRFVCTEVSSFDVSTLQKCVYEAMIEASKYGVYEFVSEMLKANPNLVTSEKDGIGLFCYAIAHRQEEIYNLIYSFIGRKDYLLSCVNPEKNNILHTVALIAPTAVLDRTSGPALQLQRELQWFQEIWSLAKPRYREDLNIDKLTPRELFTKSHASLIEAGEKAMKDTAQSSTVVGALIVTFMFAAAFTVPGGNNQDTGLPIFSKDPLFRIFVVCDALSLYSSTTSVLVFLGVLTSRYAEQDFIVKLPRKLIIGLASLFFSITTMMVSFCTALAIMLDGQMRYILPTVLLAFVPIMIFMSSIVPVLSEIFMSTFGPSIFDKTVLVRPSGPDAGKLVVAEGESVVKGLVREEDLISNNNVAGTSTRNSKVGVEENIKNDTILNVDEIM